MPNSRRPCWTFDDLRGRRFAINEPASYSGHGCIGVELSRRGESAGFFGAVTISGSHEESVEQILHGTVDAAAIDTKVLDELMRRDPKPADRLRRVVTLGPAAMPPIVASASLSPERQQELRSALTGLAAAPHGKKLLADLPVVGFVPVADADYATMRELLATAVSLVPGSR